MVFYSYLERLSGDDTALVTWNDGTPVIAPSAERSREFVEGKLRVTPLGKEVLAGKKDWQRINKRTRWLGGVEIKPGTAGWRWDPAKRRLVRAGTESATAKSPPRARKKKSVTKKKPPVRKPTKKKPAAGKRPRSPRKRK